MWGQQLAVIGPDSSQSLSFTCDCSFMLIGWWLLITCVSGCVLCLEESTVWDTRSSVWSSTRNPTGTRAMLYTVTDHLYIHSLILFIYSHWSSLYTVTDPLYIQSLILFKYSHWSSLYTVTDPLYIHSLILFIYSHWSSLYTVTDPLYIQSLILFIYSHWSSLYTLTDPLYIQSLILFIYSHWSSLYTVTDHLYIQSLIVFIYSHWSSLYTVTDPLYIQSLMLFTLVGLHQPVQPGFELYCSTDSTEAEYLVWPASWVLSLMSPVRPCFRCKGVIDIRGQRISCSHFVVEDGCVAAERKKVATPTRWGHTGVTMTTDWCDITDWCVIGFVFRFISRAVLITDGSVLPTDSEQQVNPLTLQRHHQVTFQHDVQHM